MRAIALAGLLVVLAGCRGGDDPPPPAVEVAPVAYSVATEDLEALSEAEDPIAFLDERGEVVARSELDTFAVLVLGELLLEEDIDLLSSRYDPLAGRIAERTGVTLLFLAEEQRRRHEGALATFAASEGRLQRFYEEFTGEESPGAGAATAEMLGVLRTALDAAREGRVSVVPVLD